MSRTSIPNTMFSAATPGLGKFAAAIAGSNKAGQDAYDQELMTQSKIGLMLAQMKAAQAKADESQHAMDMQSAPAVRNRAMLESGIPLDAGPLVDDYLNTGKVGLWKPGSDAGLKGAPSAPSWWDASKMGPLASRIAAAQAVQAGEAKGAEDYFKGQNQLYETDLNRRIVNGVMPADQMARGMALQKATPLYKIPEGYTGNQFSGDIDVTAPVNSYRQGYVGAQTRAQNANAVQSLASADASRASAAKSRQETQQGGKTGNIQIVTDSNGNVTLVDKASGQARPAMGLDGKPLQGKGGSLNGEQANALTFASRMDAADKLLGDLAQKGVTMPGLVKRTTQGTLELIPLIGEKLAEGPGAALTNWTQSPAQQQVEQAQRDFINAVLRRESGAAISMPEFANAAKQYFPQQGDSDATIKLKAAARRRVINGMLAAVPPNMRSVPDASNAFGGQGSNTSAPGTRTVTVDY